MNLDHLAGNKSDTVITPENNLRSYGCKHHITCPTRQTTNSSSMIDVLYVKTAKKVKSHLVKSTVSNHFMIGCIKYLEYQSPETTSFRGRSYRKYTREEAEKYFNLYDKTALYSMVDADLVWDFPLKLINKCADTLCPLKNMTVTCNKPAWITNETLRLSAIEMMLS